MSERSFKKIILACSCLTILLFHQNVGAQVRQSSNYQIQSDSVNFGGGLSSSTNYTQESTFGEVATGGSTSTNYSLKAGYQQMQEVYLALTGGGNVVMDSSIPGVGGGSSLGSSTFTVITDSPSGYQLTIKATSSPAMQSGLDTIADYAPATANPDLVFTYLATESVFAYSPFGTHVAQRFQTNGSACNVSGSASSTACWDGLSTSAATIANSSSPNHPAGTDTTIYFKVGIGTSKIQTAGTYVATTTVTLLSL